MIKQNWVGNMHQFQVRLVSVGNPWSRGIDYYYSDVLTAPDGQVWVAFTIAIKHNLEIN